MYAADEAPSLLTYVFTSGTPIRAAEINKNFADLSSAIRSSQASGSVTAGRLADGSVTAGKLRVEGAAVSGRALTLVDGKLEWRVAQGPAGAKGDAGPTGAAGAQGPKGEPGAMGQVGPKGETGAAGASGQKGEVGAAGPVGPQGAQGNAGPVGPMGPEGKAGPQGPQGPAGATGPQGPKGEVGATGPAGPAGATGTAGATGPQGSQGNAGPVGPAGPQGPKGDTGAAGPVGPQGPAGPAVSDARFGGGMSSGGSGGCFEGGVVGQVFMFAGNYAPNGAMAADGRLLSISQNTALFSILGVMYGGNGTTTFALPDLRNMAPKHAGAGQPVSYFICTEGYWPTRD